MKAPLIFTAMLLLALPALAVPTGSYFYEFGLGGQSIGREAFTVDSFGDTLVIQGESQLSVPQPQMLTSRTIVHLPDLELVSTLLITGTGDTLLSMVGEDSVLVAYRGQIARDVLLPFDGTLVPLDNGVAQHLWLLAQRRQLFGNEDNLNVLVPQSQYTGPLTWRDETRASGFIKDESVDFQRQGFGITGLLSELDITDDGELLAFRVPLQGFEIRRADFRFSGVNRPKESRFEEKDLIVEGGGPGLGGTLTLPEGEGPFPALIMMQGSGPVDRDATIGPNRLFFDLAQGLAENGVATLRYDKRTFYYQQNPEAATDSILKNLTLQEEVVDDAEAAFRLLIEQEAIDPDRCFILGHSLGAIGAPLVSRSMEKEDVPVKGLVLLAPPARDLLTLMLDQYEYLNQLGTLTDELLEEYLHYGNRIRDAQVGLDETILGAYLNYWDSVVYQKPLRNFQAQDAPALLLFGERDYQVPRTDMVGWRNHLDENPRENTRLEQLDGLNHLFLHGVGAPNPEEYGKRGELEPKVIELIADWVNGLN
ncbi:alpha/beta fold hydrolase [bacterium]|nr:alpha/beta fold hydrolase [bacterium]